MIWEATIALGLFLVGYGAMHACGFDLPAAVRAWCAYPIGAALWVLTAVAFLSLRTPYEPTYLFPALVLLGAVAVVVRCFIDRGRTRPACVPFDRHALIAGASVVVVSAASAAINMTAMTNDAYWMLRQARTLLETGDVYGPAEFLALRSFPIGVAVLQLPASLIGRDYVVSQPTTLGVTGLGALMAVTAVCMRDLQVPEVRIHRMLFAAACFIGTAFFVVFQLFYVRGNLESGVYAALGIVSLWLAARTGRTAWAAVGIVGLLGSILFRVENPLFLLPVVVVAVATTEIPRAGRLGLVAGYAAIAVGWYGSVLLPLGEGTVMDDLAIGLTVGAALALVAMLALVEWSFVGAVLERYVGAMVLLGIALSVVVAVVARPAWMGQVFLNISRNMFEPSQGLWGVMWLLLVPLYLVGAVRPALPQERLLTVPIGSYLLLVFLSGAVAGIPHKLGWASSANRMLSVIVLTMVIYVLLRYALDGGETSQPGRGQPTTKRGQPEAAHPRVAVGPNRSTVDHPSSSTGSSGDDAAPPGGTMKRDP